MSVISTAIATLGRSIDLLAGSADPEERERALQLAEQARRLLAASARAERLSTRALAERVQALDRQLADRDAGERREVVCTRLGLSKTTYYRLRRLAADSQQCGTGER